MIIKCTSYLKYSLLFQLPVSYQKISLFFYSENITVRKINFIVKCHFSIEITSKGIRHFSDFNIPNPSQIT